MSITVTCPKCKARLTTKGDAKSFRCVKCQETSPMPISKLAKSPAETAVAKPKTAAVKRPPPKPSAGWYPDPDGAPTQRYFDGQAWTDQLAPLQSAPLQVVQMQAPAKSGAVAGLLQLFLGWFGLGRFYLGYTTIGVVQLVLGLCGLLGLRLFGLGIVILVPLSIWLLIEGIMMIAGAIPEANGRNVA